VKLSVFETVIIALGSSSSGDPMFYEEVGNIPPITVFLVIILLYRFSRLTGRSKRFEEFIEGNRIINEENFRCNFQKRKSLAQDEFFLNFV
jgi:uncharacterized membrane protein YcaP (DUF421 family)